MSRKIKKVLIIALALCVAGVTGFGWVNLEQKKHERLLSQQKKMFDAKVNSLNKLVSGEMSIRSFGDNNKHDSSDKFQTGKLAARSLVFTSSVTCMAMGTTTLICWLLLLMVQRAKEKWLHWAKAFVNIFKYHRSEEQDQLTSLALDEKVLSLDDPNKETEKIDALYCDKESLNSKERVRSNSNSENLNVKLFDQLEQKIRKNLLSDYNQNAMGVQDSLKAQNKNLEKQVTEFKQQMAQTVKEASLGHAEPVKATLDEMAQQISAIREYASYQQNRNEKLQEGYDWNIIRTFCLRQIRCIDNLENRIAKLSECDTGTTDLEEIMDEMIFALESSGVEQFRPEVNSDYSGKEKIAEVIKEKAHSNTPAITGKIAEIIKPGYQYVIDDNKIKIVRTARVKLFG